MASDTVKAIPLSIFASASLSGTYQAMNSGGLPNSCFLIKISNGGSTDVLISFDGTNNIEMVRANSDFVFPSQANSQPNSYKALSPKGRIFYIKGTAGTGTISLSGYYV